MIPRPEYPRPQFQREAWQNLNGEWEFMIDSGKSGMERKVYSAAPGTEFPLRINVPFCPESKLSGLAHTDFMEQVWYRRAFDVPAEWVDGGKRVILHFGAVDYAATVFVNGEKAGTHFGGYTPFSFDVTELVKVGSNTIVVSASDELRERHQPCGKQSGMYYSHGCDYTRTTGIWQTVWAESVPANYIKNYRVIPDPENGKAYVTVLLARPAYGEDVVVSAFFEGEKMAYAEAKCAGYAAYLTLELPSPKLWDVGKPNLYDLVFCFGDDRAVGYFGMRSVALNENAIMINGRPVFQRLVLDQGFFPDGIYTAPSDAELKADIERSMAVGFNGARLHQKVFEPRFLYWADRLGYIVWGEQASWGLDIDREDALLDFLPEWREEVERDFNHPSIVGWCPFNETHRSQQDRVIKAVWEMTKNLDPTRPVIDTSGYVHVATDVFDIHDYEQNSEKFFASFDGMNGGNIYNPHDINAKFDQNIPYFVSEYGGTWWNAEEAARAAADNSGWGYGNRPRDIEEVYDRIERLTKVLLDNPRISAYCYTQLTDIEQEQNGIYSYDRTPKFDAVRLRKAFGAPAAIEK